MGVTLGFDIKKYVYVLCRDCLRTRTLSDTHVANKTATAIRSPYMAFGLAPAFV